MRLAYPVTACMLVLTQSPLRRAHAPACTCLAARRPAAPALKPLKVRRFLCSQAHALPLCPAQCSAWYACRRLVRSWASAAWCRALQLQRCVSSFGVAHTELLQLIVSALHTLHTSGRLKRRPPRPARTKCRSMSSRCALLRSHASRQPPWHRVLTARPAMPQAQLLDSLFGTERGLAATSEVRAEINELITQLEGRNPNPSLDEAAALLDGCWKLVYASNSGVLALLGLGRLPGVTVGDITQTIESANMTVENQARGVSVLSMFGSGVAASWRDMELDTMFTKRTAAETPAAVALPPMFPGSGAAW